MKYLREETGKIESMKALGPTSQSGTNACSGQHNCSRTSICVGVGAPNEGFSCLCPNGMEMKASGECVEKKGWVDPATAMSKCDAYKFRCTNGTCIDFAFTCGRCG